MTNEDNGAVYDRAIKLLNKQDYSEYKIRNKLENLGLDSDQIDFAIEKIKKENFLNDERYKRNLSRKLLHKGFSPVFIKKKLNYEGIKISQDEILLIFEEEGYTPKTQIKMLVERKLKKNYAFENEVERQKTLNKLMNFTLAKGHDYEEILEYLEEIL